MLFLRVRLTKDNGTTDASSRYLPVQTLELGQGLSTVDKLTFSVSRDDFVPDQLPFVVRVEYSTQSGAGVPLNNFTPVPDGSLFIIEQDGDDSRDASKMVTYEAQEFVPWLLAGALIPWHSSVKDNKRVWVEPSRNDASSGWMIAGVTTECKNAGWFPMLNLGFTNTKDSNGSTWPNADKTRVEWSTSQNILEALTQYADDGLAEWTSSGTTLNMYRPGTKGTDKSELVLGGPDMETIPVRRDASGLYSHVRAAAEGLPWKNFTADTTIRNRFGHRSIMVTQSGVKDRATSDKLIQPYLAEGKEVAREESYEWTPTYTGIVPFRDFRIGDTLTARARGGTQMRRATGIVITQEAGRPARVAVRVGDTIVSGGIRARKRAASIVMGGGSSGSGTAFPTTPTPAPMAPIAPVGLNVTSNVGSWDDDGSARSVVTVGWAPVTEAEGGTEVDVTEYEVWSRLPGGTPQRVTATTATEITLDTLAPGLDVLISVRARSAASEWGPFSSELLVTPTYPDSIKPKPVGTLTVSNNSSVFSAGSKITNTLTVSWPAVTQTVGNKPATIERYEVFVNDVLVASPTGTTYTHVSEVSYDRDRRRVKVRAVGPHGVLGDFSPVQSVIPAIPPLVTRTLSGLTLTTEMGAVTAQWAGVVSPANNTLFGQVYFESSLAIAGPWVREGPFVPVTLTQSTNRAAQNIRTGDVGERVYVRVVYIDPFGRSSGSSGIESIVREALTIPELDDEIQDLYTEIGNINNEVVMAGGKLTISPNLPTVGDGANKLTGSAWYRREAGGITSMWEWNGTAWVTLPLDRNVIPQIDIGTGTFGNLTGARLTANSIEASKVLLSGANLVPNPDFAVITGWTAVGATPVLANTSRGRAAYLPRTASNAERTLTSTEFYVSGDTTYTFSATILKQAGTTVPIRIEAIPVNSSGNALTPVIIAQGGTGTTWEVVRGQYTVPNNVNIRGLRFRFVAPATTATTNYDYLVQPRVVETSAAEMLVDGSIQARTILADEGFYDKVFANDGAFGRITATMLEADLGGVLDISANESITLQVTRANTQDGAIAGAVSAAGTANVTAGAAKKTAEDAVQAVEKQAAIFVITDTGAEVRTAEGDDVDRVVFEPDKITFYQSSQPLATIKGTVMNIEKAELREANIAGHRFTSPSAGRTIIRTL